MRPLTKDEIVRLIKRLSGDGFIPFLGLACDLESVPRHIALQAYTAGNMDVGSKLDRLFAENVNKIRGKFIQNALAKITMPGMTKAEEPQARQLANLLGKLDREMFGTGPAKAVNVVSSAQPADNAPMPDLDETMAALEELE